MPILKMDQTSRFNIIRHLLNAQASVQDGIKLGDTINFSYTFKKIRISGKGVVIRIEDKCSAPNIKVLCKKDNVLIKLFYTDSTLVIKKLTNCSFKTKRANLNYIVQRLQEINK